MGEEVLHGDVHFLVRLWVFPGGEIREVVLYRIHEAHLALLYQLHEGKGGAHAFGNGGQVKQGFHGHGVFFRDQGLVAEGLFIH